MTKSSCGAPIEKGASTMPDRSAPYQGAAEHNAVGGGPTAATGTYLEMRSITKVYPDGTKALDNVTCKWAKAKFTALLGENGAGKSTLMKILSGILPLTSGTIFSDGQEVIAAQHDRCAGQHGIGMVHQHFSLVPNFTAIENVLLGRGANLARPNVAEVRARMEQLMDETGLKVPLDTPVELLPVGTQQRIEILKTLDRASNILILDEPTAVLTPQETDQLFEVLQKLAADGIDHHPHHSQAAGSAGHYTACHRAAARPAGRQPRHGRSDGGRLGAHDGRARVAAFRRSLAKRASNRRPCCGWKT